MVAAPSPTRQNRPGTSDWRVKGCGYDPGRLRGMMSDQFPTALDMVKYLSTLVLAIALPMLSIAAEPANDRPDPTEVWSTWGGAGDMELRADFLPDFGLEILISGEARNTRSTTPLQVRDLGSISVYAPNGNFEDFDAGRLTITTNVVFKHGDRVVSLEQLVATSAEYVGFPALKVTDGQGRHLLTVTNPHVAVKHEQQRLIIENADIIATRELADLLDLSDLAGMPLGMAAFELNLHIPPNADLSGFSAARGALSCNGRPFWSQDDPSHVIDVALINMSTVAYQGRQSGTSLIKAAPSAQLQNVNFGDAIWVPKFSTLEGSSSFTYPFTPRDQHPYLVWNMYRIADGRIAQIGSSGVKHAFFSLNNNCDINCGSGRVLWPGCTDTYSSGTNDSNFNQGPRHDITPADALFFSTGSFFDPAGTGSQTNNSASFQNRLLVDENELSSPDATYFFDAWYVVLHDIDIWNSMGFRPINPTPTGAGWVFNPGSYQQGATIRSWVSETTVDPNESHAVIVVPSETPGAEYPGNQPKGHLRVLAKATEVAAGRWRYNYAVQNYDFDRNIDEIRIPLPGSAQVFETFFKAPVVDGVQVADWTVQRIGGELVFTAPPATPPNSNDLTWFSLFNFEVETDATPAQGSVSMRAAAGSPSQLNANAVVPDFAELVFENGFETSL